MYSFLDPRLNMTDTKTKQSLQDRRKSDREHSNVIKVTLPEGDCEQVSGGNEDTSGSDGDRREVKWE